MERMGQREILGERGTLVKRGNLENMDCLAFQDSEGNKGFLELWGEEGRREIPDCLGPQELLGEKDQRE